MTDEINRIKYPINRGIEFFLKERKETKKSFQMKIEKIISIFKKNVIIHFNFFIDVKNK